MIATSSAPEYMKLPGPVSPCTSTTGQSPSSGRCARNHANASVITGTPPPARRVLRLPLGDLVEHVLADRARRTELGEVEGAGVEAVQHGQLLHELLRDRELVGGVGDLREAAGAVDALHQERGLGGVRRDQRGHAHRGGPEGPVDRGFPGERVEGGRLRSEPGIGTQPELDDGAVGQLGVDRMARRATRRRRRGATVSRAAPVTSATQASSAGSRPSALMSRS